LQLGLQSIGASGIVASHVGQEAPRAVEQADAVGERHRGVFEFLVDREDGLHALLGGPTRPAVERLGAGAAGDLPEGDEALLRDVELAAQAPVVGFEEVAGVVGGRNLGRDLLASILTALVGPGALPDFEQNCPPLERARPRAAHSDLGQAFGSLRLAHRRLDKPALFIATSFRMEGAGLPSLPTGTTTTIFNIFKDQRRAGRGRSPTPSDGR
jgi:hypothetical protein